MVLDRWGGQFCFVILHSFVGVNKRPEVMFTYMTCAADHVCVVLPCLSGMFDRDRGKL